MLKNILSLSLYLPIIQFDTDPGADISLVFNGLIMVTSFMTVIVNIIIDASIGYFAC